MTEFAPINYSGMQETPNIGQSFGSGFQVGALVNQLREQQAAKELATKQLAAKTEAFHKVAANPTHEGLLQLSVMYPDEAKNLAQSFTELDKGQQTAKLKTFVPAYMALQSGNHDAAINTLQKYAEAHRNSGDEDEAAGAEQFIDAIKTDPNKAKTLGGLFMAGALGPEKFAETFKSLQGTAQAIDEAPVELEKKTADATIAKLDADNKPIEITNKNAADAATATIKTEEAKNAPEKFQLDKNKILQDISASKSNVEIAKQNSRIAAMNAALSRESNELKRDELKVKINDAQVARDQKARDLVAGYEGSLASFDNTIDTVKKLKSHPGFDNAVGTTWLPGSQYVPGSDAADFKALVETLQSQAFLSQIEKFKGMGALSDAEGKKLNSAIANLSTSQSEKSFTAALDMIDKTVKDSKNRVIRKYGADTTAGTKPKTINFADLK